MPTDFHDLILQQTNKSAGLSEAFSYRQQVMS